MLKFLSWVVSLLVCPFLLGQQFVDVSASQQIEVDLINGEFGNGTAFYDFDKDGWDDLFFCSVGTLHHFKNVEGNMQLQPALIEVDGEIKHALFADYDNDGDADVLLSMHEGNPRLFNNDGEGNLSEHTETAGLPSDPLAESYGAAWGDYDRDGFLDLFLANYNWNDGIHNWLLRNNGDGTFQEVGQELFVTSASIPTFQAVFTDINRDLWPDIYIINDKAPANELFLNTQTGFANYSTFSATNVSFDAMSNSIADYNNDGYLDIYVSNDQSGSALLENQGNNHFFNVTDSAGAAVNSFCWAGLWIDIENDMNEDLYVATNSTIAENQNWLLKNTGQSTFEKTTLLPNNQDKVSSYSLAKGDFNNDGYYDIASFHGLGNGLGLYENTGGNNRHVSIDLHGIVSNRDGIGAWIEAYFPTQSKHVFTTCGENYLGQNSHKVIIPCGGNAAMDSLIIRWPSGIEDHFFNTPTNQHLDIFEGMTQSIQLMPQPTLSYCAGDFVWLSFNESDGIWNTGEVADSIMVAATGSYFVQWINLWGDTLSSDTLVFDFQEGLDLEISPNQPSCFGMADGSISWDNSEVFLLSETDSLFLTSIDSLVAGTYDLTFSDGICTLNTAINIAEPDLLSYTSSVQDVSCFGDSSGILTLEVLGGSPPYAIWPAELNLDALPSGQYALLLLDSLGCQDSVLFDIFEPDSLAVDWTLVHAEDEFGSATFEVFGGLPPYSTQIISQEDESVQDETALPPGAYLFQAIDTNGCFIEIAFIIEQTKYNAEQARYDQSLPYPNPFSDECMLLLAFPAQVKLHDALGRLVYSEGHFSGPASINTAQLPNGSYVLTLEYEEFSRYFNVLKSD